MKVKKKNYNQKKIQQTKIKVYQSNIYTQIDSTSDKTRNRICEHFSMYSSSFQKQMIDNCKC